MGYTYYCKARVFGCPCTRTRNVSIMRHERKCEVVRKFQKYLDLEAENKALKEEVARLSKVRGRPVIKFENVSIDDFWKEFMRNELWKTAWRRLYGSRKQNAVPALVRLFLAVSPRFWKLQPCRQLVEVCGWLGEVRTHGEIHCIGVGDLGAAMSNYLGDSVETYLFELGFTEQDATKLKLDEYCNMSDSDRQCIAFCRNSLITEARRRKDNGPIRFRSVEVDLSKVKVEKKKVVFVV